jgi:hypothetical protein
VSASQPNFGLAAERPVSTHPRSLTVVPRMTGNGASRPLAHRGYRYYRYACAVFCWCWKRRPDATTLGTWALAVVAFVALEDGRRSLEQSQRAWIAPTGAVQIPEGPLKPGSPFRFDIQYFNSGREPATDVNVNLGMGSTAPLPPQWKIGEWTEWKAGENKSCDAGQPLKDGPAVYPTSLFNSYNIHMTINDLDRISQIAAPNVVFVFKGCIVYKTANRRRESAYCFYLQPVDGILPDKWTFRTCGEGNHAN